MNHIAPVTCPRCSAVFRITRNFDTTENDQPKDGDITICAYCAVIMIFHNGCQVRRITKADTDAMGIEQLTEVMSAQQFVIATSVRKHVSMN